MSIGAEEKSEPEGSTSGHSCCRRLRFALSLAGPYCALSVIVGGKDLYILEFGASAEALGGILLVISIAAPVLDFVAGNLQDSGGLSRCFSLASWGRRAPWFLTHNTALAPLMFLFALPPSYELGVLHLWFTVLVVLGYWCYATCINSFEASRVEIYPFKEERLAVEKFCKLTVIAGGTVGTVVSMMCLTYPNTKTFGVAGFIGFLTILSCNAATTVMREAKSQTDEDKHKEGVKQSILKVFRSGVVLRMVALRGLQGIYEAIIPCLMLYYFTFVYKLDKETRLAWLGAGMVLTAIVELTLAPLWSHVFAKSTKLMLYIPLVSRIVCAVLTPVIISTFTEPAFFMGYLIFWRICNSGYSFWRVAACGWICDHEGCGEGMVLGLFTMVNSWGRALTNSLAVLGLAWAGLVATNCLELEGEALDMCEHEKIHSQPDSLGNYLQVMIAWVAPAIELLICTMTYEFPIRPGSQMLEDVCQKKAKDLTAKKSPPSNPQASESNREGSLEETANSC